MLEFDYLIERNNGKQIDAYSPKIPKKLSNLCVISGPNDSGKSTLLNLIALSFGGLDNKNINPALKERMRSLINSDHQKVQFKICITDKKGQIQLISKKDSLDDEDISIFEKKGRENLKRITRENFENKYLLIYDIPDNPLGRIKELNNELYFRQQKLGDKIKVLNLFLSEIIREINESKDPKKISELKNARDRLSGNIEGCEDGISTMKNELRYLTIYNNCKIYVENQKKIRELKDKFDSLEKTKNINLRKTNKLKKRERQLIDDGQKLLQDISSDLSNLKMYIKRVFPSEFKNVLSLWEGLDIKEILFEKEEYDILLRGITEIEENLLSKIYEDNKNPDKDKANLLHDLIDVLSNYKDLNTTIPGIEKNIEEFIDILEKEYKKFEDIQRINKYKRDMCDLIDHIKEKRQTFISSYADEMKEIEEIANTEIVEIYDGFDPDDYFKTISELDSKIKKSKVELENSVINLGKMNIPLSDIEKKLIEFENDSDYLYYRVMNKSDLEQNITRLQKEVNDGLKDIEEKKYRLKRLEDDIQRLEKMEPHKYQDYYDEINNLFTRTQKLHQKILNDYSEYLSDLIKEKVNVKKIGEEQKDYYEKAALFLGRKIDEIRHEDKNYKINKINVLSRDIVTKEGTIIKYTDLGTGQSQAAYLKGLLNLKDDNRPVIALIDEVAMMDSNSLNIVFDSLKKLDQNGKLLLGLVVQRSDELSVKPIN